MSKLELFGKQVVRYLISDEQIFKDLAKKYNLEITDTGVNLCCPWVVNPLNQTEEIKFEWSVVFLGAKPNKNYRFMQALNALEAIDILINGDIEQGFNNGNNNQGIETYNKLGIFGRVMFFNILKGQDNALIESIIKIISPFASKGLDMNSTDFIKAEGVTVGQMFYKLIKPTLEAYTIEFKDETTSSSNNNNNVAATEEKEVKILTKEEKEKLEKGKEYLKGLGLLSTSLEEALNELNDPKGFEIKGVFKEGIIDIFSNNDQNNFNNGLSGLVIESSLIEL